MSRSDRQTLYVAAHLNDREVYVMQCVVDYGIMQMGWSERQGLEYAEKKLGWIYDEIEGLYRTARIKLEGLHHKEAVEPELPATWHEANPGKRLHPPIN